MAIGNVINVRMSVFCLYLSDQDIDEEAFHLLDEETIKSLIPKIGPRLKFCKLLRELVSYQ